MIDDNCDEDAAEDDANVEELDIRVMSCGSQKPMNQISAEMRRLWCEGSPGVYYLQAIQPSPPSGDTFCRLLNHVKVCFPPFRHFLRKMPFGHRLSWLTANQLLASQRHAIWTSAVALSLTGVYRLRLAVGRGGPSFCTLRQQTPRHCNSLSRRIRAAHDAGVARLADKDTKRGHGMPGGYVT